MARNDINNTNTSIGQQNIDSNIYNNPIHIYGEKKVKKFIGVLPFFSDTFLGRERDLEAFYHKLFKENNLLLLINGEGGIGKSTLAAQYYLKYRDDYQHLAWVFAGGSLRDALLALAMFLEISFPETMPANERMEMLLHELRNLNKPCLLVIDNADEVRDLEDHYQALRSCANFHLLITTRTRITSFEQTATRQIKPLKKTAAFALFKKHYPAHRQTEDSLLDSILVAVGYNTLVIELLAKNLHNVNRLKLHYSLAELLQDLQNKGLLALSRSAPVGTAYKATGPALRKEKPELIIEAMYELSSLTESESTLLSVFAVLPAESIVFTILETLIPDTETLEDSLLSLSQKGWLDYNDANRSFKVSPVVQEITKKNNSGLLEDCQGLLDNLIAKLDYEPGTGHFINATYQEAGLYARYAETVVNSFDLADPDIAILYERAGSYHQTTGNLDKALDFYHEYNRLQIELYEFDPNAEDKNGLAISYSKLGNIQASLGNLESGLDLYEEYNRLKKELYEAHPQNLQFKNGLAISYQYLGITQTSLGNLNSALVFFQEYNRLEKELYDANPQNVDFKNDLAISYSSLGERQASLGNLNSALHFYKEYSRLKKELYEAYPQNVSFKDGLANSYQFLGRTQASLNKLESALDFYLESNRLEKELYEAYPQNVDFKNELAISYSSLGDTQASPGKLDSALDFYQRDVQLTKELYDANPQNVHFKNRLALSYFNLSRLFEQKQNRDEARKYYQSAEKHLSELVAGFPMYAEFKRNLLSVQERLSGD